MTKTFPQITTDRLLLRQFTKDDLENVYNGLSHPDVIKYYGVSYHTLEATKEQMEWFANLEKEEKGIWWAVCSKDNSTFYGGGGFNDVDKTNRKAEIGFWLLPEYWGKGIMKEAMPLMINHAFTEMNLHRIEGYVDHENSKCKKAIVKLDFQLEGTMRDYEIKDGKFTSCDIYAKLNK